jgi:predicted alpha/beta superfamily hydrolase
LLLSSLAICCMGQITIIVDEIPFNTPSAQQIYIAGTFNKWTPNATPLAKMADGRFKITLPFEEEIKFKFTRGDWNSVECQIDGSFLPDRAVRGASKEKEFHVKIVGWNDFNSTTKFSTANEGVSVMTDSFYIPQLNSYRRVWVYLPSDYATSKEHYPVLYMHDGQNVFDASTSFSGEWCVDETLAKLEKEKGLKVIVIAIDNGQDKRLNEYTPWSNPKRGGGDGAKYMDFIVHTLKLHVDSLYRTKPQREFTGLMGSSLGGLISMYGIMEHPDVFGRAGVFSPSFWFSDQAYQQVKAKGKPLEDTKIYMIIGRKEGSEMVKGGEKMNKTLRKNKFTDAQFKTILHEDGAHSEWYWKREFEQAVLWLFMKEE